MSRSGKPDETNSKHSPKFEEAGIFGTGVEDEDTSTEGKITKPFDPALIRIETQTMSIDTLLARIRENELQLQPGFQRRPGIWKDGAQSRLVESLLIKIPLPAFYMDATDEDNWLVVDGLQRLTTLKRFVLDQKLRLTGLEFLTQYEGMIYKELPRKLHRRILETQVTVYRIESGTPSDVKFNIFKRINTGGLPLSPQEIRHALNQGKATELLAELAKTTEFKEATSYGVSEARMDDRECCLRFLAFTLTPYTDYTKDNFDAFLNDTMGRINIMNDEDLARLGIIFKGAMTAAKDLFGNDAFRKRYSKADSRKPVSKALFEAWAVNLGKLSNDEIETLRRRKRRLKEQFINLMHDRLFDSSVSQGTGDIRKVTLRFESIEKIIQGVLHD